MKRFFAALRFLTVLPVPASWAGAQSELSRSAPFFVPVGLLVGALAAALAWGLSLIMPPLPAAVLIVLALSAVSGGLHADGLSDTADGLLGARDKDRALQIMRDGRAGPMGVMAIFGVFALKVAVLASLPQAALWRTALLMPVAGRCALLLSMALLPYARPEGGLASAFYTRRSALCGVWAVAAVMVTGWLLMRAGGLAAAAVSLCVTVLLAAWLRRRLGGATGDTLGAACEIAGAAAALSVLIWCWNLPGFCVT